ncbi:MAG: endolytic transglycosylase MltG [Gemmatimonadota bacterium]
MRSLATLVGLILFVASCSDARPDARPVEFTIPDGAAFSEVTDTLAARDLVAFPTGFRLLARVRGNDRGVRAGRYRVASDIGWLPLLDELVAGRVVTLPMTIPEGYTLRQIAPRISEISDLSLEEVEALLKDPDAAETWGVPGPTLEGYLFPDTYRFTPGAAPDDVIAGMVERYLQFWTDERRRQASELGLSEREVATLASIVQAEARRTEEMPTIAGVFHNRLAIGYLLQADPTVQYALEERQQRLLYSHIDSVSNHPYNTYTQPGLPPGPIGSPGEAALQAALEPADVEYLYFVARPDGSHIFTSSLQEHNRARVEARREWVDWEREDTMGGD